MFLWNLVFCFTPKVFILELRRGRERLWRHKSVAKWANCVLHPRDYLMCCWAKYQNYKGSTKYHATQEETWHRAKWPWRIMVLQDLLIVDDENPFLNMCWDGNLTLKNLLRVDILNLNLSLTLVDVKLVAVLLEDL